jgi:hypothetical protein
VGVGTAGDSSSNTGDVRANRKFSTLSDVREEDMEEMEDS